MVPTKWSAIPSCSLNWIAAGFCEINEAGPRSTMNPADLSVAIFPPNWSPPSRRDHSSGVPDDISLWIRYAAASPAMPPPIMITFFRGALCQVSYSPATHPPPGFAMQWITLLLFGQRIWYILKVPLIYYEASLLILSGYATMSNSAALMKEDLQFEKKA